MSETDPVFKDPTGGDGKLAPIFQEKHKTSQMKWIVTGFLVVVSFFVAMCIILVSVQSFKVTPIYVLLLINLLAFAQIEIFVVFFIYTDRLSKNCFWVIFLVGAFIIIESVLTDVLVFTI